jgi:hypothetical protein
MVPIADLVPSRMHSDLLGVATHYLKTSPTGETEEIKSTTPVMKLKGPEQFVDSFNAMVKGKATLGIRSGSIVPFFKAPKQPTTKLMLVISQDDVDGEIETELVTVAPGRMMPRLPSDSFYDVRDADGKRKPDDALNLEEQTKVAQQVGSQESWWNTGFLVG